MSSVKTLNASRLPIINGAHNTPWMWRWFVLAFSSVDSPRVWKIKKNKNPLLHILGIPLTLMLIQSVSKWINMEDLCVLLWDILTGHSAVGSLLRDNSPHTNTIPLPGPILTIIRRCTLTADSSSGLEMSWKRVIFRQIEADKPSRVVVRH